MSGVMMRMRAGSRSVAANPNGSFSSYLCSQLLTHVFVSGPGYSPPLGVFLGLFTQAPTVDGGGTEVSGDPNYMRTGPGFATPIGPPYMTENTSEIDFNVASVDWGFIAAGALFDQPMFGNMLAVGLLLGTDGITPTPRLVQAGDIFVVPAAGIQIWLA